MLLTSLNNVNFNRTIPIKNHYQKTKPDAIVEKSVKTAKSDEAVEKSAETVKTDESAGGIKINDKLIKKVNGKVNYMKNLLDKLQRNSDDVATDYSKIVSVAAEIKQIVVSVDPTTCTADEISELNGADANAADIVNKATEILKNKIVATNKKAEPVIKSTEAAQQASVQNTAPVQQSEVAHTEGGFNINNFIKPNQQTVKGPTMPANNNSKQQKSTAFPHQICGLTDEQILAEVRKHFKVLQPLSAYELYDLLNNRLLARKMKEFDAKQRPNNPFLTQVNINEYIDVPELLQRYSLCFTMPCNDKSQIIVVLFNPVAVPDKNGVINYPLHILKAAKINDNK